MEVCGVFCFSGAVAAWSVSCVRPDLGSTPLDHGLRRGDRVSVNPDEISDWAYLQNGRLVGGYTIRALYAQLPRDRQKELQNEVTFPIARR